MAKWTVGRALKSQDKYHNDKMFRKRQLNRHKKYYLKNKEKELLRRKIYYNMLKDFFNKRCLGCGKLLSVYNKSGYCRSCRRCYGKNS